MIYLAGATLLAFLVLLYYSGRRNRKIGKQGAENAALHESRKASREANEARMEVDAMDDPAVIDKLREDYTRK